MIIQNTKLTPSTTLRIFGNLPSTTYHLPLTSRGFTIVELLVAIVVIGIIAAITIVAYNEIQGRAAVVVLKSDLDNASAQLTSDYVKTGSYAANADSLPRSSGTIFTYTKHGATSYCISATSVKSGNSIFHISSAKGNIEDGACPSTNYQDRISAGQNHTCAIASNNLVYCWGSNSFGQLGDNSTNPSNVPVAVNITNGVSSLYGKTVKSISAGASHTCAIASDDLAYCWGNGFAGRLGDNNDTTHRLAPVAVNMTNGVSDLYGKTVKSISAGGAHTCAIASDDLVYCWGNNEAGALGVNTWFDTRIVPKAVNMVNGVSALYGKTVKSVTVATDGYTCAIGSDDLAYCWGGTAWGGLGSLPSPILVPRAVNMINGESALYGKTVKSIKAGVYHTCVVASDDLAYCWGYNQWGQLGNNTYGGGTDEPHPVAVNMANGISDLYGKTVKSITADSTNGCVLASDNLAYCWGFDIEGELGNNTNNLLSTTPVAVSMADGISALYGKTVLAISSGGSHTCVIASDNLIYCWGVNSNGELGDGTSGNNRLAPVATIPF